MNKLVLLLVLLLVLAVGSIVFTNKQQVPVSEKTVQQQKPTPSTPSLAEVSINKDGFLPETLHVKKGTVVKWTNLNSKQHWIASDPHPTHTGLAGFDSQEGLAANDAYTFTFEKSGTFTYHDHLNPLNLKGTVIVD